MIEKLSRNSRLRKAVFGASAAAVALGMGATASAGGGYVSAGYSSGYYGGGYYAAGYKSHRGHHRGHGRRHHRHGGGGGKAAAIALGVIGGAIILNEIAEDRERERYARERYYEDRYARPANVYDDRGYDNRGYDSRGYDDDYYEDEYYDEEYDSDAEAGAYDGVYEEELDGGAPAVRPEPIRVSSAAAYETCLRHARTALGERGFVISAPYRPDTVEARGGAVLMTATVTAQRGGERWARAMSCEASETRVYRMELI